MKIDKELEITVSLRNNKIKAARKRLKLTQKELAIKIGIPYHKIVRAECLDPSIGIEAKNKIAKFLGLTIEEVFPKWIDFIKTHKITKELDSNEFPLIQAQTREIRGYLPPDPEIALIEKERALDVDKILKEYTTDRDYNIIKRLISGNESQNEIAKEYNMSRERIRQIYWGVVRKLRDSKYKYHLKNYYKDIN